MTCHRRNHLLANQGMTRSSTVRLPAWSQHLLYPLLNPVTHTKAINQQCCFQSCAFIKIYLLQPRNISQERERRFLGESVGNSLLFSVFFHQQQLRLSSATSLTGENIFFTGRRKTKHAESSVQSTDRQQVQHAPLPPYTKVKKHSPTHSSCCSLGTPLSCCFLVCPGRKGGKVGGLVIGGGGSSCFG